MTTPAAPFFFKRQQMDTDGFDTMELVTPLEIANRLKCSVNSVYNLVSRGYLPKPCVVLGLRGRRWKKSTIDAWFQKKIESGEKLKGQSD